MAKVFHTNTADELHAATEGIQSPTFHSDENQPDTQDAEAQN